MLYTDIYAFHLPTNVPANVTAITSQWNLVFKLSILKICIPGTMRDSYTHSKWTFMVINLLNTRVLVINYWYNIHKVIHFGTCWSHQKIFYWSVCSMFSLCKKWKQCGIESNPHTVLFLVYYLQSVWLRMARLKLEQWSKSLNQHNCFNKALFKLLLWR